jgi:hypothetical protein
LVDGVESARAVGPDSTTDLEAARRPCPFTLSRRRGSSFGGFVTRSNGHGEPASRPCRERLGNPPNIPPQETWRSHPRIARPTEHVPRDTRRCRSCRTKLRAASSEAYETARRCTCCNVARACPSRSGRRFVSRTNGRSIASYSVRVPAYRLDSPWE